ncbi:MAG: hypothetical protein ABEI97_05555 [Candidatus Nanohaloarchaea archaeon]
MPETHTCPECGDDALDRTAAGVWECGKCGATVAGGAYEPDTGAMQRLERAKEEGLDELEELEDDELNEVEA